MKRILPFMLLSIVLLLTGCFGHTSTGNDVMGQIKKVIHHTPFFLPNYYTIDLSLGIMRDGTGSMSREDLTLYVPDERLITQLKSLAEEGRIVKVSYGEARATFYVPNKELESVQPAK